MIDSLHTHVGGKVDGVISTGPSLELIPELRVAWYHECLDNSRGVATSLAGAFGSFDLYTLAPERDYALVGLGLNAVLTGNKDIPIGMFLNYDVQAGQSSYLQNSITGGVKASF